MPQATQLMYAYSHLVGTTGQSWRSRNNLINTHSSAFRNKSALTRRGNSQKLEGLLTERDKQSNQQRKFVSTLRPDANSIDRSKALIAGMSSLQDINLLGFKDLNHTVFPGVIRNCHIYNDYHLDKANPGYSRNYQGKHFTT